MEMLFVQPSFAFLVRIRGSKIQYFSLWAAMFEHVGPNEALTSHLTKLSEIYKNQTESEDSNDPDLDIELESDGQIKSFIYETQ